MKIEHLQERINDYKTSIETVVEKKMLWKTNVKPLLIKTLKSVVANYDIGWQVQELDWINSNEAVNITLESFPPELIDCTNQIPSYQFILGGALVFSQSYSGDIYIFIVFPDVINIPPEKKSMDLGVYNPKKITPRLIVEKVDVFLKEMINWDLPTYRDRVGFQNQ
ncbi:MAG: hypothetical protein QNJ57_12855 [Flavobacteriaceae bacterium]|nr:hypothetical protein [Flavobacteriaceae bacterium]